MHTQRAFFLGQVPLRNARMGQIPGWGPGTSLAAMPPVLPATTNYGPTPPMTVTSPEISWTPPARKTSIADVAMMGAVAAAAAAAVYGLLS